MVTAEIAALFLILLAAARVVGLTPHALSTSPPLDVITSVGGPGPLLADLIAHALAFSAFLLVFYSCAVAVGFLMGDDGRERVRISLARARDERGLRPMLWLVMGVVPGLLAWWLVVSRPADASQLIFMAGLVLVVTAQTLRPFEWADLRGGLSRLSASIREVTRPPVRTDAGPATGPPPDALPPATAVTHAVTPTTGWLELRPRGAPERSE